MTVPAHRGELTGGHSGAFIRLLRSDFLLAILAGMLSVCLSGYAFGIGNNLFHLPIVAGLPDMPQFEEDMFIQSLHHFSSGLWMLLEGADQIVPAYWLFLILLLVSRALTFWGVLFCCQTLGISSLTDRLVLTGALLTGQLMYVYSFAGAGGIFVNAFTHSEIANGLTLISLGLVLRNRLVAGLAVNGMVLFVNGFVAVWNVAPIGLLFLYKLLNRQMSLSSILLRGAAGSFVLLAIGAPVLLNLIDNPSFGHAPDFDYIEFLTGYFPDHFLIREIGLVRPFLLLLVIGVFLASLLQARAGQGTAEFLLIGAGYILVYLTGMILPELTASPFLLNLHLLRVSTFLHILAATGCGLLAISWLKDTSSPNAAVWAWGLLVLASIPKAFILLLPYILVRNAGLADGLLGRLPRRTALCLIGLAGAASITFTLYTNHDRISRFDRDTEAYRVIGAWAKTHTDPAAIFLLPMGEARELDDTQFQYASHRRVWVNFKQGAAAMWYRPFHALWRKRTTEVMSLTSLAERAAYARENAIDYVLAFCEPGPSAAFSHEGYCAYRTDTLP